MFSVIMPARNEHTAPTIPHRPSVLLLAALATRFNRGIFQGMVGYARQQTNWRLTCQDETNFAVRRRARFDGVLLLRGEKLFIAYARRVDAPIVLVGNPMEYPQASSVSVNEEGIGELAAGHFTDLGLKHFAFVAHGNWPFVPQRMAAFAKAVASRGLGPVHELLGVYHDYRRRPRFERDLRAMLQQLPRPCGLLAANDELGVFIVETCRSLGLRVPDDIAVLGVDDDEMECELSEVPLSSVQQPLYAMGYEAARLLHQHMADRNKGPTKLLLPPVRVVPRASSDLMAMADQDVAEALRLIKDHASEPINVAWLVQRLPVARRTLQRKFLAAVGRTILAHIHHVRFQKAKTLLVESDLALELVARNSGFANARWMADRFRRELGITPGRYRRQFRTES